MHCVILPYFYLFQFQDLRRALDIYLEHKVKNPSATDWSGRSGSKEGDLLRAIIELLTAEIDGMEPEFDDDDYWRTMTCKNRMKVSVQEVFDELLTFLIGEIWWRRLPKNHDWGNFCLKEFHFTKCLTPHWLHISIEGIAMRWLLLSHDCRKKKVMFAVPKSLNKFESFFELWRKIRRRKNCRTFVISM